ncbi:nucleotidyltransferase family protein [Spirosoma panaciterrae]|uniref:nucleotidyltransferase family protein n=1 Tax=Spirosoma panaciterrae TaxID=496058 RepID=UPI0003709715|nr:nucleotidyltransferase domain-containing protein [Spirosoma panaciterrae]
MVNNFQSFQAYLTQENIFDRYGLSRIGVFGSFARGETYRDIDILLEEPIPYPLLIALKEQLQDDLQIPVDVMLRQYAEPIILHRALKDVKYAVKS